MPKNETWSHRILLNGVIDPPFIDSRGAEVRNFADLPADEVAKLNGTTIVNSDFMHHEPGGNPWPVGMEGVRFQECVLTNCVLPRDCFLMGCDNFALANQTDMQDWLCKDDGTPVAPLDEDLFKREQWSLDPAKIPTKPRVIGTPDAVQIGEE